MGILNPFFGITSVKNKDGKEKGIICVPERPSSIQFGGTDDNTLSITGRSKLFNVKIK